MIIRFQRSGEIVFELDVDDDRIQNSLLYNSTFERVLLHGLRAAFPNLREDLYDPDNLQKSSLR